MRYVRPLLMKHRTAVLRALGPTDDETVDLAFALGLLARDVTRVVGKAGRELFGVLATRIPTLFGAFSRPAAVAAAPVVALPASTPVPALAPAE